MRYASFAPPTSRRPSRTQASRCSWPATRPSPSMSPTRWTHGFRSSCASSSAQLRPPDRRVPFARRRRQSDRGEPAVGRAAYGLLVLVFQEGVGNELFGFPQVDTIEAWVPLFLFAVLFGLSMDYHVFLLSRIRERFRLTGDNTDAVAHGVASTGRIITGAALIIIAVFSGFARGDLVMFQQMGFGVAVACCSTRRGPPRARPGGDGAARRTQLVPALVAAGFRTSALRARSPGGNHAWSRSARDLNPSQRAVEMETTGRLAAPPRSTSSVCCLARPARALPLPPRCRP